MTNKFLSGKSQWPRRCTTNRGLTALIQKTPFNQGTDAWCILLGSYSLYLRELSSGAINSDMIIMVPKSMQWND